MDRLRSAFNSLVNSERYNRFTLQPAEDGERHVEVKLSDDGVETEGEAGGSPTFRPAPRNQSRRNACFLVLGAVATLLFGYLVAYISLHTAQTEQVNCSTETPTTPTMSTAAPTTAPRPAPDTPAAPELQWKDITDLLAKKLTQQAFETTLRNFDRPKHSAGSEEDTALGNHIFAKFKELEMDPWTDIHYVQLPTPDSEHPNRVLFGSDVFKPVGYLAYSATGRVQGKLVYGNYGRREDLDVLLNKKIELNGCVLLLRAGNISFAEKVYNAATNGSSAVLIYPDDADYDFTATTELYGHVHLGSGDPYTPGFPSFNHTQFPPTESSGLPKIPAQTITAKTAKMLLQGISGPEADGDFKGGFNALTYRLGGVENVTVEVNNLLVNKEIHNVYGVIKGFIDPDRYVVLGAQRDAWGNGYAKATIGTSVLVELAKAVHEMVENDGFRPKRSLVFASWSAGEYGSVGATEWLEGYISSIDRSVVSYINLDGLVLGRGSFMASASPLLHSLLENTMKEVKSPFSPDSMYKAMGSTAWQAKVLRPMSMEDPAYPFLAFSGIPSISFHFISANAVDYPYYGTDLDNADHLNYQTNHRTGEMTAVAAQFAGQMALRLVHDHLLSLDVNRYSRVITNAVGRVYNRVRYLVQSGALKDLNPTWIIQARGSFQRAVASINAAILNTDFNDKEACRILNDRIMRVEHTLLSPYVSPLETPFRHLLVGRGSHTLSSIAETSDLVELHTQLALATWSLQGCANAMVGDIWDIDNGI